MLLDLEPSPHSVQTIESTLPRPVARWRQVHVSARRGRSDGRRWERALERCLQGGAEKILLEKIATAGLAQRAIRAVQAGHLVLSTMEIGRACTALAELSRLQLTTTQIIDGLSLVIGQRLTGRLCTECSVPDDRDSVRQALAGALNTWLYGHVARPRRASPKGCARCRQTGYSGLVLVYELLDIDARARSLIASSIDPVELERALLADGSSIWDCGLRCVADGTTSFDALVATVREPH
jgi:general secretion pathway protein E